MKNVLDKFYLSCGVIAAISMIGIVMLVAAQIIARFFHTNIPSSDDISGYMVAWSTFMGLAYAMNKGDHIRVDLFINMLSPNIRRWFGIFVGLAGFILITFFIYFVYLFVKESYDYGDFTSGHIAIPLWWVQIPYLFGVFALGVSVFDNLISLIFSREKQP